MPVAPVCEIPTKAPIPNPLPVSAIPAIPVPEAGFGSIINTIQQIKKAIENLNQINVINGFKLLPQKKKKKEDSRWVEIERVHSVVRITNPADKEQYVDVDRITKLVFQDTVTGNKWVWSR